MYFRAFVAITLAMVLPTVQVCQIPASSTCIAVPPTQGEPLQLGGIAQEVSESAADYAEIAATVFGVLDPCSGAVIEVKHAMAVGASELTSVNGVATVVVAGERESLDAASMQYLQGEVSEVVFDAGISMVSVVTPEVRFDGLAIYVEFEHQGIVCTRYLPLSGRLYESSSAEFAAALSQPIIIVSECVDACVVCGLALIAIGGATAAVIAACLLSSGVGCAAAVRALLLASGGVIFSLEACRQCLNCYSFGVPNPPPLGPNPPAGPVLSPCQQCVYDAMVYAAQKRANCESLRDFYKNDPCMTSSDIEFEVQQCIDNATAEELARLEQCRTNVCVPGEYPITSWPNGFDPSEVVPR